MAKANDNDKQRIVNTRFWDDSYLVKSKPYEKLLFVYCLTNSLTNISGVYEIQIRRIEMDLNFDKEKEPKFKDLVKRILLKFGNDKKMYYIDGWLCIKNFIKYQKDNPKVNQGIKNNLKKIPQSVLEKLKVIDYTYYMDILSHLNSNLNSNSNLNKSNKKEIYYLPKEEYPEWLNKTAWEDWEKYRNREADKSNTEMSAQRQLALLSKYSKQDQEKIISKSIMNNYRGLFALNDFEKKEDKHISKAIHGERNTVMEKIKEMQDDLDHKPLSSEEKYILQSKLDKLRENYKKLSA